MTARRHPGLVERREGVGGFLRREAVACFAFSAAAFLASAPLAAFHFAMTAPAGMVSGLLAIPLCGWLILPFGLCAGLAASALPSHAALALPLALPAAWGCRLMAAEANLFAWRGAAVCEGLRPTPAQVVGCYLLLGALLLAGRRRILLLCCGAGWLAAATLLAARLDPPLLRATFLDVGNGDAAIVETGEGTLLVDAGGRGPNWDRGASVVLPALRAKGVRSLDLLVLSHDHPDHAGGAPAVLSGLPVGGVVVPPRFDPAVLDDGRGAPSPRLERVAAGERISRGGVTLRVSSPPRTGNREGNEESLVCLVDSPAGRILFTGDAGSGTLDRLARGTDRSLAAELVKVPHHGSRHSWSPSFWDATGARLAVISSGKNPYGHPDPVVTGGLAGRGTPFRVTGREGSLECRLQGKGVLRVIAWTGAGEALSPHGLAHWLALGW